MPEVFPGGNQYGFADRSRKAFEGNRETLAAHFGGKAADKAYT